MGNYVKCHIVGKMELDDVTLCGSETRKMGMV